MLESGLAFAIFDRFPVNPGHVLVIPRRHVADIFELTESELREVLRLLSQARQRIAADFAAAGVNVGVNVGDAAGQTIAHAHLHLIPRYTGDVPDPTGGVRGVIPGKASY
ncbi:MAG: HIT family protein [Desulfobacterales bacterium]|nr:HIT family protein [Desulfobacterales bacterium]